jgi:exopolyphosphatase/guanosine-5'-triphosphate,3'-diphosphate pyrophosphatase
MTGAPAGATGANPEPGGLTLDIADHRIEVMVTGGGRFTVPIGPVSLVAGPLEHADLPAPAQLTNALGLVHDHLDDIIIEAPSVAATPSVVARGVHVLELARVEIGGRAVPDGYVLDRTAADEVFRTLALEPVEDRRHNPGLDPDHVESIVGTCCVILGVMRRLDLDRIHVATGGPES